VRILIHETIMSITLKYGTLVEREDLQSSVVILREMTTQVCRSVAFHLGFQPTGKSTEWDPKGQKTPSSAGIPGG
jgi:hypothetical protein